MLPGIWIQRFAGQDDLIELFLYHRLTPQRGQLSCACNAKENQWQKAITITWRKKTDQFSGADLKAVIDVAIEKKLREAMKEGVPKPLSTKDLAGAAATLKPTTKEWFATARNYALYSNQGGIYDDILQHLKL